jgi:hypothetical protein
VLRRNSLQLHDRSVADRVENAVVNHAFSFSRDSDQ